MKKIISWLKNRLFYYNLFYWDGEKNAGDDFNKDILKHYNIRFKKRSYAKSTLIGVGSILESIVIPQKAECDKKIKYEPVNVMGSGFIERRDEEEKAIKELYVLAIRGALTLERLKRLDKVSFDENLVLADPGLMASVLYKWRNVKKYNVGIIPHYIDKNCEALSNIKLSKCTYKLINIQGAAKDVCREISECDFILSSSLHGLIFADSYNVPNFHIVLSDKLMGGDYKFRDYYSAFGLEYPGNIDLRNDVITDETIEELKNKYQEKSEKIKTKQKQLEKHYKKLKGPF